MERCENCGIEHDPDESCPEGGHTLAVITVTTPEGEVAEQITVKEFDHINMRSYLHEVYYAVDTAARMQGIST